MASDPGRLGTSARAQPPGSTRLSWLVRHDQMALFALSLIAGIAAGYAALAYRRWVELIQEWLFQAKDERLVAATAPMPDWQVFAIPLAGSLVVAAILRFLVPGNRPHAVAEVIEAAALRGGRINFRVGLGSALSTATALGVGASTGREGPMIHAGATLASVLARGLKLTPPMARTLLGCGVASAIAASFNAPIAGVIFALEVVIGHYALHALAPVVIAGVAGTVITRIHVGDFPAFIIPELTIDSFWEFPAFLLLGVISAFAALAFMRLVMGIDAVRRRLLPVPEWMLPPVAGLAIGGLALVAPHILGVSYETTDAALNGALPLWLLLALIPLKMLATALCLACRFGNGVFSPSLFVGAMTGGAFAALLAWPFPDTASSDGVYVIVGMAAVASSVLGAPISTLLIVFELTGNYEVTIAVMLASAIASLISSSLSGRPSLFHMQLERRGIRLEGGKATHLLKATSVQTIMTKDFAPVQASASVEYVRMMLQAHEGKVPVIDEAGRLTGVVTAADLPDRTLADDGSLVQAGRFCQNDPVRVTMAACLEEALKLMERTGEDMLPVVHSTADPVVVGMLRLSDVLTAYNRALLDASGMPLR